MSEDPATAAVAPATTAASNSTNNAQDPNAQRGVASATNKFDSTVQVVSQIRTTSKLWHFFLFLCVLQQVLFRNLEERSKKYKGQLFEH